VGRSCHFEVARGPPSGTRAAARPAVPRIPVDLPRSPGRMAQPDSNVTDARGDLVRLRAWPEGFCLSRGRTVLSTGSSGMLDGRGTHGLFVHETRVLSRWRWRIDGEDPRPAGLSNVDQHSWLGYYALPAPSRARRRQDLGSGQVQEISQQTLELRLTRRAWDGLHEDVDLESYSQEPVRCTLELEIDGDFADFQELKEPRRQRGRIARRWRERGAGEWELAISYTARHLYEHQGDRGLARLSRGVAVRITNAGSPPRRSGRRIAFEVELAPRQRWHACLDVVPSIEGVELPAPPHRQRPFEALEDPGEPFGRTARFSAPGYDSLAPWAVLALEHAKRDLFALRMPDLDREGGAWVPAAGLPMYLALFGRDTLTAAWQSALLGPEAMRGTLAELAHCQGARVDDWRDEQPGRILHEAHTGPLSVLNYRPQARYYGSVNASSFYAVVLSELWHWTGDRERVAGFIEPALRALRWLDEWADLDGDGFYEYRTRSEQGVENQGWKDSGDAIVDAEGRQVEAPIATCEEQGFAYTAKLLMSELLWWFDRKEEARRLFREAGELKRRFNEVFWMEDERFVPLGLDSRKQPIRSITSNPGHCIATAVLDRERVGAVAERLLAEDLFSGWGVRTLSSRHPAYNPYSYHRGSVWPVEQGTFALGFYRHGLHEEAARVARAQFEAAELFDHFRLPEVFGGHPRDAEHPFPALYPQANSPQAWSSSSLFLHLQAMLGIYPYAPLHLLLVDPWLPEWLPRIRIEDLRVGDARISLEFERKDGGASSYRVLEKEGMLHVVRQPSPWSLTTSFAERLIDALQSFLPGR
jgi:glycogen debranching enzyme